MDGFYWLILGVLPSVQSHDARLVGVKCWESNSIGAGGTSRKDWYLTPMSSFNIEQGGCRLRTWWLWSSGPGGCGVLDLVVVEFQTWWLWSSGPGGCGVLDLVVAEFWSGCGGMDLASAYVLRPLNRLVLDFVTWNRGW